MSERFRCTMASAIALMILVWAAPMAQAQAKVVFDLPAQPLADSLRAVGSETNTNLLFDPPLVAGKRAPALKAEMTVDEALTRLLEGTSIKHEFLNETTIVLAKSGEAGNKLTNKVASPSATGEGQGQDSPKEGKKSTSGEFRVAQVDQGTTGPQVVSDQNSEKKKKDDALTEIVVTGTHIRGEAPVGSSLTTYSREQIQQSGAATVDQFARVITENVSSVDTIANANSNANFGRFNDDTNKNVFGGAAFNIHGVGVASTLTLLNGQRLAPAGLSGAFADISQIPVSAIDRIEVLSDGASAIYGADAVAGVVNIITRKDFDGAETGVRYGQATSRGAQEITASQLVGRSWNSANVLFSYEYDKQNGLDAADRSWIPSQGGPDLIIPPSERNSFLLSGSWSFAPDTELSGTALYSDRTLAIASTLNIPLFAYFGTIRGSADAKQYGGNLTLAHKLSSEWQVSATASYSKVDQSFTSFGHVVASFGTLDDTIMQDARSDVAGLDIVANGTLMKLPAGAVRSAWGASIRRETFEQNQNQGGSLTAIPSLQRHAQSAFGELVIPIVGQPNAVPAMSRLEVSLAVRYDHYGDFGSTTNPKVGLMWDVVSGLSLRGSYGRSFRAPLLSELGMQPSYGTSPAPDPQSATGQTDVLTLGGGNPNLRPETARSLSAGFDAKPENLPGLLFSATYFHIDYSQRISIPPLVGGNILGDPALTSYVQRDPPLSLVESYFPPNPYFTGDFGGNGPSAVGAIFDSRFTNIASTKTSGVDTRLSYALTTAMGEVVPSVSVTRLIDNTFQPVAGEPSVSLLNDFAQPTKWKARGNLGWSRGPVSAGFSINYVGSYPNTLATPTEKVDSWTTGDLYVSYRTGSERDLWLLNNLTASLTVQNVTDEKPPFVNLQAVYLGNPIPFDTVNASPVGRLIALQVNKKW
jgi:iron complex outermembrane receptor protein